MTVPPVPAYVPAGAPAPKVRPVTVTASGILMYVLALLALAWGVLTLVTIALNGDTIIRDQMREAERQGQDIPEGQFESMVNFAKSIAYGTGAILVLFAIGIGVLGFLVMRGSRVGRILSWIATGLFALCGLCSLGGSAAGTTGAIAGLGAVIPVVVLLCALAVIVLLALPASNAYFAKPVPQWEPPADFGTPPGGSTEFGAPTTPQPPAGPEQPPAMPGQPEPPAGEQPPERPPHTL